MRTWVLFLVLAGVVPSVAAAGTVATSQGVPASLPLPAGAATSAKQDTGNTSLSNIDGKLPAKGAAATVGSTPVNIASDQTVPVSAASLPLPSGAATGAKQDTGNTSLSSINGKLPAALGPQITAASMSVNIASDQTVPVSAASLPLPTGAATGPKQDTGNSSLSSIDGKVATESTLSAASNKLPASLGQKAGVASMSVIVASDQTVPVSAASLPIPTGASTEAKQPALGTAGVSSADVISVQGIAGGTALPAAQSGTWNITNVSGTVSLPTNAATATNQDTGNSSLSSIDGKVILPAALDVSGYLKVHEQGTATVTGSVTANLGTIAGAATAVKQPALGTAGTPSADVITVQGITSMTALKTDGSAVTQPVSGTVTASQGGTWTVQPGNTANTTAWLVTGTGGTFPVTGTVTANLGTIAGAATEATLAAASGKLPAVLGQAAMADSMSVTIANNQSAVPVSGTFYQATQPVSAASLPLPSGAATAANQLGAATTLTGGVLPVTDGAGGTSVLPSEATRKSFDVCNMGTAKLLCIHNGTPSAAAFTFVLRAGLAQDDGNGDCYHDDRSWTGPIDCIAIGAAGRAVRVSW